MLALFCVPIITSADNIQPDIASSELLQMPDSRIEAVQSFLNSHKCGTEIQNFDNATEFIDDADTFGIDWRVLPIVWWKESQCGKHQVNGNGFGFESSSEPEGLKSFVSLVSAIDYISSALTHKPYAGKSLHALVSTYNNHPEYWTSFEGYYTIITSYQQEYEQLVPMIQNNQLDSKSDF